MPEPEPPEPEPEAILVDEPAALTEAVEVAQKVAIEPSPMVDVASEAAVEAPLAAADPAPATPPVTEPVVPAEPAVVVAPASQASFTGYGDMKLGSTLEQAKTAWAGELQESKPAEGSTCHYLMPKWVSKASEFGFMMEEGKFVRYDVGTAKETAQKCAENGLLVLTAKDMLRFLPPLTIRYEEIDKGLKILKETIS